MKKKFVKPASQPVSCPLQSLVDSIIKTLEAGQVGRWENPFKAAIGSGSNTGFPRNVASNKQYRGANVLLLWEMAKRKGYSSGQWGTFKQWLAEGGCVRKGEKACPVIFWKFLSVKTKEGDDSTDTETEKKVPMLRYYYVFNRDQVDGLPARSIPSTTPFSNPDPDLAEVRAFYQKILGTWEENPNIPFAHYDRRGDKVVMFPLGMCKSSPHFYHTLGHESAHWSGAPHRLNRTKGRKFGDCFYAFEELVAELTSTFLSAALGLPQMDQLQESSVKYLNTWIKALKEDPRVLLSVASKGQEAFDFLMNAGGKAEIEEESFEDERAAA